MIGVTPVYARIFLSHDSHRINKKMKTRQCYSIATVIFVLLPPFGATVELLNFQALNFSDQEIEVGVHKDDSCHYVLAEIYGESDALEINSTARYTANATENRVVIPRGMLHGNTDRAYLRLSARNIDGTICSASQTHFTLYHFPSVHNSK